MEMTQTRAGDLSLNGYSGEYIFETMREHGFYEKSVLTKWLPVICDALIIFDVGANIGNHSLFWAAHLPEAEIYAFEPYAENYTCLTKNIIENQFEARVHTERKALGNERAYAQVISVDSSNLGATTFQLTQEETGTELITIDEYVEKHSLERVDFVKIDTEGFEIAVLEGMAKTIDIYTPIVWVEVAYSSYQNIAQYLAARQYKLLDAFGFNMLYVHESNATPIFPDLSFDRFFDETLKYLERTNTYYRNYTKAKKQNEQQNERYQETRDALGETRSRLEQANSKYREVSEQNQGLKQKLLDANSKYREASEQNRDANNKYREASEQNRRLTDNLSVKTEEHKSITQLNQEYAQALTAHIQLANKEMELLQDLNRLISSQQTQINSLRQENEQYRRKLSRITDTWYGKIAITCYRYMGKVLNRLKRVGGR